MATHPERFAPLHTVATALLHHLAARYDVTVEEGAGLAAVLEHAPAPDQVVRACRLTPRGPARESTAPLTIVLTRFPGVLMHAGALASFAFPVCGCDACDDSWGGPWPRKP